MLLAGTRNNMFATVLLPLALWPLYTRRVVFNALLSLFALVVVALPFAAILRSFFDSYEFANYIKLLLVRDYVDIFDDREILVFGQGLGAYQYWSALGREFYTSELTYLEMIRNFGLIGAAAMMLMLLYPLAHAFTAAASRRERALAVAYFLYLAMCISNPNLFSSMGMLILAAIVANIALSRDQPAALRASP